MEIASTVPWPAIMTLAGHVVGRPSSAFNDHDYHSPGSGELIKHRKFIATNQLGHIAA
jgi:hypothetical protein